MTRTANSPQATLNHPRCPVANSDLQKAAVAISRCCPVRPRKSPSSICRPTYRTLTSKRFQRCIEGEPLVIRAARYIRALQWGSSHEEDHSGDRSLRARGERMQSGAPVRTTPSLPKFRRSSRQCERRVVSNPGRTTTRRRRRPSNLKSMRAPKPSFRMSATYRLIHRRRTRNHRSMRRACMLTRANAGGARLAGGERPKQRPFMPPRTSKPSKSDRCRLDRGCMHWKPFPSPPPREAWL